MRMLFTQKVAEFLFTAYYAVQVVLLLLYYYFRARVTFLTDIWISVLGLLRRDHNVQSFRKDYMEKGPDDLPSQIPHLRLLAEHYSRKARNWKNRRWLPLVGQEPRWLNYIKAHGILNSCIARKSSSEVERKIYELESDWYSGNHPLRISEFRKITKRHKGKLNEVRKKFKNSFHEAGKAFHKAGKSFRKDFNADDLLCPENRLIMKRFSKRCRKVSEDCTRAMNKCVKKIMQDSVKIVEKVMGPPPCLFSIVLFGSLAREIEGTPFSDIEFGFIVQSPDHHQYFTALAVDIYFRLNNLAETPLKSLFIKELHELTKFGGSTFDRWFDDRAPSGLKFDGITPRAGNIPTGNGLCRKNFILTPKEMFERYRSCYNRCGSSDKVGDEADMFSTSEVLYEYKRGNGLYALFQWLRTRFEHRNVQQSQEKKAKTLIDDLKKFEFTPVTTLHTDMRRIQIKQDIFRFPTLFAHDLKMVLNIDAIEHRAADKVFDWLLTQGCITDEVHCYLSFSLMSAIWCRNSAYLSKNSQDDNIAPLPKYAVSKNQKSEFHIPTPMFVSSMYISHKIKDSICSLLRNELDGYQRFNTVILRPALRSISIDGKDFFLRARLHHTCADSDTAMKILETTGGYTSKHAPNAMIGIWNDMGFTAEKIKDLVWLTADVLYHLGEGAQAKAYFTEASELPNVLVRESAVHQLCIAGCYIQMGKYADCYLNCSKASNQLQKKYNKTCFEEVLKVLLSPNEKLSEREKQGLSFMLVSRRAFLNNLMDFHQGCHAIHHGTNFETLKFSYHTTKQFLTDMNVDWKHHAIGELSLCIGMRYDQIGDYKEAGKYFDEATKLYKDCYGADSATASSATAILTQASTKIKLGEYVDGVAIAKQSLKLVRKIPFKMPSEEYHCLLTLAEAYLLQKLPNLAWKQIKNCDSLAANHYRQGELEYSVTLTYILKARLNLLQKRFEEARILCLRGIHRLAFAVSTNSQNYLRDKSSELELPSEVVESASRSLPAGQGNLDSHPRLCEARGVLADITVQSGEGSLDSAEHLLKGNLKGYEKAYGVKQAANHPATAARPTYFSLAALEHKRGDNNKSREYSLRSLDILRDKFKDHPNHPRIIENNSFLTQISIE